MPDDHKQHPRIADIALHAGVGTATVDRVLNGRPGVRPATVARVQEAARWLEESGARPRVQTMAPPGMTLRAMLGGPPGFANEILMQSLRAAGRDLGLRIRGDFIRRNDVRALCEALDDCQGGGIDGVVVQAVEHPRVRDAIARLLQAGIPVISVLTPLPGIDGVDFVGLDNRAAGRVAGQMLGLLCHGAGDVAVFYTDSLYRSLEERDSGLRSLLREDFPAINIVERLSTFDTPETCYLATRDLLARRPGLKGICNLAAGNRGIERAVHEAGLAGKLVYVAFNLTPLSRQALIDGTMQAVIHQDMRRIARRALTTVAAARGGDAPHPGPIAAEIILRENLRDFAPGV